MGEDRGDMIEVLRAGAADFSNLQDRRDSTTFCDRPSFCGLAMAARNVVGSSSEKGEERR